MAAARAVLHWIESLSTVVPGLVPGTHEHPCDTVRFNLLAFDAMDSHGWIRSPWLRKLDRMITAALAAKLTIILDEHDSRPCDTDVARCARKLSAVWKTLGSRYSRLSNRVLFEIFNEPQGAMDPAHWNGTVRSMLAVIRQTSPTRNVVVDSAAKAEVEMLPALDLPADDRHIIASFHYYRPGTFTHQGAPWRPPTPTGITWGKAADLALLQKDFDSAKAWSTTNNRPIFLGEFGTIEYAPMESRARYTAAVARAAEARGFAWTSWQFDNHFRVFKIERNAWIEPLLRALVPQ
jgi:endoglucanase